MNLLERAVPITAADPARSKLALYRITDPYVSFWHRFVSPMISAGMIGLAPGARLWSEEIEPRMDNYMGGVFESVCRSFVRRGEGLPFVPLRVGEWWDSDSRNEIDVVALGAQDQVFIGECKWGDVRGEDLETLRRRAALLVQKLGNGPYRVEFAIFSGRSVSDSVRREAEAGRVWHFPLQTLYSPE